MSSAHGLHPLNGFRQVRRDHSDDLSEPEDGQRCECVDGDGSPCATGSEIHEDGEVWISGDGSYLAHLGGWDLPEAEQVARSRALFARARKLARDAPA